MGMLAVYSAIDDKTLDNLQEIRNENLLKAIENIQENENCEFLDIDKIWDGLHFLLTGSMAQFQVFGSLVNAVLGGTLRQVPQSWHLIHL